MLKFFLIALFGALSLVIVACGAQTASDATSATTPKPVSNATASDDGVASACATDNHAPLDSFRPDPVNKLTASTKPKLVEFYAVW